MSNSPSNIVDQTPLPGFRVLALLYNGNKIKLRAGETKIGRDPTCDIVLDDLLVSRVHARFLALDDVLEIEDLGSTNGVWVNADRIQATTSLRSGDRVVVGEQELEVIFSQEERPTANAHDLRKHDDQKSRKATVPMPRMPTRSGAPPSLPRTDKADALFHLGKLVDRLLSEGHTEAAVRALSDSMSDVIRGARDGMVVPPHVLDSVSRYALKFATVTNNGTWIDYMVELHLVVKRPMRGPTLEALQAALTKVPGFDRELLAFYQAAMDRLRNNANVVDRALCEQVLTLRLPK